MAYLIYRHTCLSAYTMYTKKPKCLHCNRLAKYSNYCRWHGNQMLCDPSTATIPQRIDRLRFELKSSHKIANQSKNTDIEAIEWQKIDAIIKKIKELEKENNQSLV